MPPYLQSSGTLPDPTILMLPSRVSQTCMSSRPMSLTMLPSRFVLSAYPSSQELIFTARLKYAAKQVTSVTGGKVDVLIHVAAKMDLPAVTKGFDDL